ncbi:MAG: hypothetical protein ACSLEL_03405 [Candidatus Malihini olakiniferum]
MERTRFSFDVRRAGSHGNLRDVLAQPRHNALCYCIDMLSCYPQAYGVLKVPEFSLGRSALLDAVLTRYLIISHSLNA